MAERKLTDLPLSWGCLDEAIEVVWAALDKLPDDALDDDERDQLNTAMAWLKEAGEEYPG